MTPLRDKMSEFLNPKAIDGLCGTGLSTKLPAVRAMPMNYVRGADWKDTCIIVDEAQNCTFKVLLTVMTRLSTGSKMFIIGDSMQSDIRNSGWNGMLNLFGDYLSEEQGIYRFEFEEEDIVRDPLVKFIIQRINDASKETSRTASIQKNPDELILPEYQGSEEWSPQRRP